MPHQVWPAILILAAAVNLPAPRVRMSSLEQREHQAWKALSRTAQFADVSHIGLRSRCEEVQAPRALTTPAPLLSPTHGQKIKVSFIIGADGRVYTPLILESAGASPDRRVLQTVRTWRYRPATCNGVPTETEGRVEFSSR